MTGFNTAGWIAVVSAVVTLPVLLVSVLAGTVPNPRLELLSQVLSLATAAMAVYIYSSLNQLLRSRDYDRAKTPIVILIVASVVLAVINLLAGLIPAIETPLSVVAIGFVIPVGIVHIVLGMKIQGAASLLTGPVRGFSYSLIATGVCFATILLIPFALLTSLVSDLLLAMVFFKAHEGTPVTSRPAV